MASTEIRCSEHLTPFFVWIRSNLTKYCNENNVELRDSFKRRKEWQSPEARLSSCQKISPHFTCNYHPIPWMNPHLYLQHPSCYNPLVGLWATHHPTTIQQSLTTATHRSASYLDQSNVLVILEQTPRKLERIWFRRLYLPEFGSYKFPFRKSHEVTKLLFPSVPWCSHCNRRHTIQIATETHSNLGIFKSLSYNCNMASIKKYWVVENIIHEY